MKRVSSPPSTPTASARENVGGRSDAGRRLSNVSQLLSKGIALQKMGQLRPAQECYQAILDSDPSQPDALHMMGLIALEAMRISPAVAMLKRAVAHKPADPGLLGSYAEALIQDNEPVTAERMLRRALKLAPDHPTLLCALARCESKLGRHEDAKQIFETLIARDPGFPAALIGYANLLLQLGSREEAREYFRKAVDLGIAPARALAGLAQCQVFESAPPELAEIKTLLNRPTLRVSEIVGLRRAAAKICNDIGRFDEEFEHTSSVKRTLGPSGDNTNYAARYRGIREIFTAEFFATRRDFGSLSSLPIFIVGMPRSGTTLVEQILASHPEVAGGGEIGIGRNVAVSLGFGSGEEKGFARRVTAVTRREIAAHADNALATMARFSTSAARVTDKFPHNFEVLGLIALLFPRAKIIHCRRAPLDTCVSCFLTPLNDSHSYAESLVALGEYYREYFSLMTYWREALPVSILDVDYESLVSNLEEQSRRIIAFSGLSWDPACIDFQSARRAVDTASHSQVRQPIYDSSVGRWRHYEKHLEPLFAALGDLVK
jgi:tetratricopeptide (TPR) repeat protein